MVEDNEHPQSVSGTSAPSEASAAGMAMNSASRERADEYLAEQARLARLQSQNLIDQNAFELSHLRFRRFSDYARFALEFAVFLIVLLIVCGLGAMVWSAARDHDLVVDAFSVPTDVAQSGITGAVLAGRVMDRFGRLQADTFSITESAGAYRTNDVEDARVEIPDTGISIGELNRYLRQWLGHETHVAGDLVHTPKGMALTIRLGHEPGTTIEGADFDALVSRAAEYLYSAALPLRYADYLAMRGRFSEAETVIVSRASNGSARERALAFLSWAQLRYRQGNTYDQMNKALIATQLDPSNAAAWYELDGGAFNTGHREMAVRAEETVLSLIRSGKAADLDTDNAAALVITLSTDLATDKGNPQGAMAGCQKPGATVSGLDCGITYRIGYALADHDIAEARRLLALLPVRNRDGSSNTAYLDACASIATAEENWPAEIELFRKTEEAYRGTPHLAWVVRTQFWPARAVAMARSGDVKGAETLVAKTAIDCDVCVAARAMVAAEKHDWATMQHWYALVSARTPSIPYFDSSWGEALLRKGDLDAAIAKFASANRKGPHFADPLEYWGEALIRKNRSDMALAKFAEANKYAPNWGRLHLKWGEALYWSGDKTGAQKQFAIARTLDLTPPEKSQLARMRGVHG